jgi:hypothetical protein
MLEASRILVEMGVVDVQYTRDIIDVPSYSGEPDPNWEHTDEQGHHHWMSKKEGNEYPTLKWITDCPADDEYPESGHHECVICGERITPGWLPPTNFNVHVGGNASLVITFAGGKSAHCTGSDIDNLNFLMNVKFDYGFTKLRAFVQELKDRSY